MREPLDGIREGWFAFMEHGVATFKVCRLGEDDGGDLCETGEAYDVHIDFADCFAAVMRVGRVQD